MVRTRSGACTNFQIRTITKKKKRQSYLTNDMIRKNGDTTYHQCACCSQKLQLKQHWSDWLQCPQCKDVFHAQCIFKWCLASVNPSCPKCRLVIAFSDNDTSRVEEDWYFDTEELDTSEESESESDSEE